MAAPLEGVEKPSRGAIQRKPRVGRRKPLGPQALRQERLTTAGVHSLDALLHFTEAEPPQQSNAQDDACAHTPAHAGSSRFVKWGDLISPSDVVMDPNHIIRHG